ncbi:unnamed protein product [Medioppia subpectinata]|uniref:Cytosolic fatty-acid binding proteins domain-containing protein n=1 Tax=Medioppia subpectinata TaxID=1979941 RepID=A0A7R9L1U9_9ACAR|nr:unnamed protein product [Medioppia subpectinata]CAG2112812.1 unnamed protein product [Medioppia subpectinata]
MTDFTGTYKVVSADNFDAFLKELGANDDMVAKLDPSTGQLTIKKNGPVYTLIQTSAMFDREVQFELGKEYEDKHLDGSPVKGLVIADGNKLIQTACIDGKELEVVRELNGDELIVTASFNGAVANGVYQRV